MRFRAGIEAVCAADAALAEVDSGVIAALIEGVADSEYLLGASVDATAARLAFELVDDGIRLVFINVHGVMASYG